MAARPARTLLLPVNSSRVVPVASREIISSCGSGGSLVKIASGASDVIVCDDKGAVHTGRPGLTDSLRWVAEHTNHDGYDGDLAGAVRGADVFIGVSAPNILTGADVAAMAAARATPSPTATI